MPDVFISYSSSDQVLAARVYQRLGSLGVSAFLAPLSIQAGLPWKEEVLRALREAKTVLFLASHAACASVAVMHELGGALYGQKEIVPVCWEVQPGHLPEWIRDRQAIVVTPQDPMALDRALAEIGERVRTQRTKSGLILAGVVAALLWARSD